MDSLDKQILDIIQTAFPLESRPYEEIGKKVGLTEGETLARVRALKEKGVAVKQVGLLLAKGGVLRDHMEVITPEGNGITTSGVFSPSLKQSIAIARVPKTFEGDSAKVLMRGKEVDVRVLKLPFVRNGKQQFE